MKIGNLEVPDGVRLIISCPTLTKEEVKEFAQKPNSTEIWTNAKLKLIAKNKHVIVLEATF